VEGRVTITHDDVYGCFGNTINRELFTMMVGDILGAGEFRIVYNHMHRTDLVLKFEPNAQCFQNIAEWEFWHDNKKNKKVAQWLAPCEYISPCGIVLAMKKTTKPQLIDYPKRVPEFLTDLKRTNFGMLGGRMVAHDYGLYNVDTPTKPKVAKWWDAKVGSGNDG
jgi:hypothetical protein